MYSLWRKAFGVLALYVFSGSKIEKTYKAGVSDTVLTLLLAFLPGCMALYVFFRFKFQTGNFTKKLQKTDISEIAAPACIPVPLRIHQPELLSWMPSVPTCVLVLVKIAENNENDCKNSKNVV